MKHYLALATILSSLATSASGRTLSRLELFHRCYTHITQLAAAPNHPGVVAVTGGADPIDECLHVFDKASFVNSDRLTDPNDPEAVAVLNTFHKLHVSWFENQWNNSSGGALSTRGTRDILDIESPALYITRALFKTGATTVDYSEVVTGTKVMKADRQVTKIFSDAAKTVEIGVGSRLPKSNSLLGEAPTYAETGLLLGIRPLNKGTLSYTYGAGEVVDFSNHYGGGFIGDPMYLLLTFNEIRSHRSDGAASMPRLFGRAVYHDALCRQLPVVRTEDAIAFATPSSTTPFRQSSGCNRCHVSMDRTAAVARNFRYRAPGAANVTVGARGFEVLEPVAVDRDAEVSWPTESDGAYYRRPPNGVLYFRNYLGQLVDVKVSSVGALGAAIADQPDYYICGAKRYYQYFMGVDVELNDHLDPAAGIWLTAEDTYHRQKVVTYGLDLQNSQSLRQVVEAILRSADYKKSDFGMNRAN